MVIHSEAMKALLEEHDSPIGSIESEIGQFARWYNFTFVSKGTDSSRVQQEQHNLPITFTDADIRIERKSLPRNTRLPMLDSEFAKKIPAFVDRRSREIAEFLCPLRIFSCRTA
jgi:hypothetical protein